MSAIETLRDEFELDPLKVGYAAMTDQERHDSIKALSIDTTKPIPSSRLLLWAANSARKRKLRALSEKVLPVSGKSAEESESIRNIAEVTAIMFLRNDFELDVTDPTHKELIESLIVTDGLDAKDRDDLYALARTKVSRLSQLNIQDVHLGDVAGARK